MKSSGRENSAVRPIGNVLQNGEMEKSEDNATTEKAERVLEEEMEEESGEGRIIKGQTRIIMPSREEWENHMRTHIPYRRWCPHCVRARRKSAAHRDEEDQLKDSEECRR